MYASICSKSEIVRYLQVPVFGSADDRVRRFCAAHKKEGHVQLNFKLCSVGACARKAVYGESILVYHDSSQFCSCDMHEGERM